MSPSGRPQLLPDMTLRSRRQFLVDQIALGFALAVPPLSAETITTDANGLSAGMVKIPVVGGSIPAYRACPSKGHGFPVVLVVEDIFGVEEHLKDVCRRYAKAGYCAVAPELFSRQGEASKLTDPKEILAKVVSKVADAQVMSDLDAAAIWAFRDSHGDSRRLATAGFGWGGRIVWVFAAHSTQLKAGASWYGRLEGDTTALAPRNPLGFVGGLKAPVIGFYGGKDASVPVGSANWMKAALKVTDDPSDLVIYPDAGSEFQDDGRPGYNAAAAQDSWKKMLAWFDRFDV